MQLFPKSHKRKKTNVPLKVMVDDEPTTIYRQIVGVERTPFVIHRKAKIKDQNLDTLTISKDKWTVTHVFSGYAVGIYGTYEFCSAVANELLEQPIFYLPTHKMMSDHPDFDNSYELLKKLRSKHRHLGEMRGF